jgi:hypothetical protein
LQRNKRESLFVKAEELIEGAQTSVEQTEPKGSKCWDPKTIKGCKENKNPK